ncbi:MAG: malate dehydrogenase [Deltaproteobacteria bacterium CG11_big_fil_rev_8_21_14_0_20_47_16]|nr:MAG: malate dehydrogenase [Deltaproteobacteria bacterium CG11_big_fil_rev_8_21_14_0_20_47_16]
MARKKIGLIGGGQIGGVIAQLAATRELGDVVILDVTEGVPQGKALDMWEGMPVFGSDAKITGTNNYADLKGCDAIVITAGVPRKPGMSRDDLLNINIGIMKNVADNLKQHCPDAFVVVVSNPLDVMVYACQKLTGFPANKVCGMAGLLDSARFRAFVAAEIGVSVEDVSAMVLGGHGDSMVPLVDYCTVNGIPITKFLSADTIKAIVDRTKQAGGEVVALLKTGSAFVSPAVCALEMVESYLKDKKRLIACAAKLNGEYGKEGYYIGVPTIIGAGGVEKIVDLELNTADKALFDTSFGHVKEMIDGLKF